MDQPEIVPMEWETVQPHFDALEGLPLQSDTVEPWLRRWSALTALLYEADAQIYREVAENTADEEAEARFLHWVEQIVPAWQRAEQVLREKLLAVEGYVPAPEMVQAYRRFEAKAAIFRDENVPIHSELSKLANAYEKRVGGMTVVWEGEEQTIPQLQQHLLAADRDTRERAWRAIMARYGEERAALNELYLKMLRLRREVARNAGFDDFRAYQWQEMGRFDYSPDDCFTFHDSIEQRVVPYATELYDRQRALLGLERLRPWDVEADPHGEPLEPFGAASELEEGCYRIFEQLDPALAEHFATMRDGFLDLASRPNKAPGGFCTAFPVTGKPYIFMNAVGTNEDVMTLLHEGGHAFHFLESLVQPLVWNLNPPMEFCEVASLAMELLGAPFLERERGGFYEAAAARRAYAQQLRDIVLFLPYMAVVDTFQHWVYTEAPDEVDAAALDARWAALWERFMPGIDFAGLEAEKESGWHRKVHLFTAPFYYVEYGLAQLGALQVWRNALAEPQQALRAYREALALGDTRALPGLFEAAGARFAFDQTTVGELMVLIREQMDRLESPALN